jgi:hypothetical protein
MRNTWRAREIHSREPRPHPLSPDGGAGDAKRGVPDPGSGFDALPGRAYTPATTGEVAEWLNAPVSKTGRPARVAGVRISPSPFSSLPKLIVDSEIATDLREAGLAIGKALGPSLIVEGGSSGAAFIDGCGQSSSVASIGVEPIRPFGQWILNPSRLPIPPRGRGGRVAGAAALVWRNLGNGGEFVQRVGRGPGYFRNVRM